MWAESCPSLSIKLGSLSGSAPLLGEVSLSIFGSSDFDILLLLTRQFERVLLGGGDSMASSGNSLASPTPAGGTGSGGGEVSV